MGTNPGWKQYERRVAAFFNCKRTPGSGSMGRADCQSRSDTTHPRLFIEGKLYARSAIRTLHEDTRELAKKERKIPVVAMGDKRRPGFLIVVHSDDLQAFIEAIGGTYAPPVTQDATADV